MQAAMRMIAIAPYSAKPWRGLPIMRPKVTGRAKPMTSSSQFSSRLVQMVGFSNGCAELALTKPPPLVPNSLIASCKAIGPTAMVCEPPKSVWAVAKGAKVCGEPDQTRKSAATMVTGSSR